MVLANKNLIIALTQHMIFYILFYFNHIYKVLHISFTHFVMKVKSLSELIKQETEEIPQAC